MQFHTALLAALLCLPLLAFGTAADLAPIRFDLPQGIFWLWCFCVGLAATVSHMAMTYALKLAPSSTLAPLHYLEIVTASLLGYVFFGDFPDTLTWTGIGIIVASGLYIIFRERRLARAERAPVTASALTPPAPQPPL